MSKQQLYINDVAVDMPADDIKIKVASNILADVDKVMTAHSYSIALPRTMTNDSALALAYVVGANTGGVTTHRYLKASLYMDGVPLFEDGQAVVNKVDEKGYSINLFWGLLDIFSEIKEEGLDLCDLPLSSRWNDTWADWMSLMRTNGVYVHDAQGNLVQSSTVEYNSGMDANIASNISADSQDEVFSKPWNMPAVPMSEILAKIAKVYGLTFTYSTKVANEIAKLYHPLTTLKNKCKDEVVTASMSAVYVNTPGSATVHHITWGQVIDTNHPFIFDNDIEQRTYNDGQGHYFSELYTKGEVSFGKYHVYGTWNNPFAIVFNQGWVQNAQITTGGTPALYNANMDLWKVDAVPASGGYKVDINFINASLSEKGKLLAEGVVTSAPQTTPTAPNIKCDLEIIDDGNVHFIDQGGLFEYPTYSLVRNYPEVGVLDYIGEMMAHCGAFIVGGVTKPTNIHFMAVDEVVDQQPVSIDMLGLESLDMSIDEVAQRNTYKHDNNDDDGIDYDASGVIVCNDTTLTDERTAFESDFKVPRSNFIKQWDVEVVEDSSPTKYKAKWVEAGNVLCGFKPSVYGTPTGIPAQLLNTGQDFTTLIASNYGAYSALVRYPKSIEVIVRMTIIDLMNLDFTKPIYINQLGSAFLIDSITSDTGDKYKLKLIKL